MAPSDLTTKLTLPPLTGKAIDEAKVEIGEERETGWVLVLPRFHLIIIIITLI